MVAYPDLDLSWKTFGVQVHPTRAEVAKAKKRHRHRFKISHISDSKYDKGQQGSSADSDQNQVHKRSFLQSPHFAPSVSCRVPEHVWANVPRKSPARFRGSGQFSPPDAVWTFAGWP